ASGELGVGDDVAQRNADHASVHHKVIGSNDVDDGRLQSDSLGRVSALGQRAPVGCRVALATRATAWRDSGPMPASQCLPGNTHTGIATTTQLTVFYRFFP
ncbi:MAG: hypothetical protein QOF46_1868, partial [Paraburkholderia sp.]|nr:hypothetical protein [Paraburkholderia sp.]